MINIYVKKTLAKAHSDAPITSGSVGLVARFRFSEEWEELNKIAIFETDNYKEPVEIPEAGEVVVPDSVLVYPWTQLRVGVRGESEDGHVVIPTVYADCGTISLGANTTPVGTPPTPSQAEYLQAQIDELRESGIGGGITEETDPTVPAWAKAPEKPSYTAEEVGALPVGTEIPSIDITLTQSGKAADAKAVGDALGAYKVNLAKYGITAMESHKPPFTDEEWLIASNNVKGFNLAFEEAYNNGYTKVIVPKGKYPVLYQNTDTGRMNSSHYYSIKLQNNTTYDFCYSCLWVMFDSSNAQPYDYTYSNTNYYKAGNNVIGLSFIKNVDIHNLELEGERELRSFAVSNERNVESTTGLSSINEAYNIRCYNCNFHSFMADGFGGKTQYGSTGYAFENTPLTQGYINASSGSVIATTNNVSSYSELLDISKLQGQYANIWTGIGYNYVIGTKPNIFVVFYDADGAAISSVYVMQGHKFYVPSNAQYCRVQFKNVYTWEPLTTQTFRITNLSSGNFEFNHCNFYNNHRGGVSNVPNYTIFNDCEWYHNGKESYGGAPVYGDSTRYAMAIEDIQSAFVVLNHCREYDNGNGGLFLGGIDVYISNSDIEEIAVYRGVSYLVTNSTCCFYRTGGGIFDDLSLNAKCSNSTVFVNAGVGIDLSAFSNCDIIIQSGHIVSTYATTNRIYAESLAGESVVRFSGLLSAHEIRNAKVYGVGKNNSYVSVKKNIRAVECEDVTLDVKSECSLRALNPANANLTYKNCKINLKDVLALQYSPWACAVKFENCEFSHEATNLLVLNKWDSDTGDTGITTTFTGCTFNYAGTTDGYFVNIDLVFYVDKNHHTFTNCKFNNSTGYVVYICDDKDYNSGIIEFVDCSYDGVVPYPGYTA